MVDLAGNRTPSIEQSCLTETTDCPSDVSVITSISCLPRQQQSTTSPLSSSSSGREDSLAARLAHPKEEEAIQRVGEVRTRPGGDTKRRPNYNTSNHFLPPTQLRALIRDRLQAEGISLSCHPYTQSVSTRRSVGRPPIIGGHGSRPADGQEAADDRADSLPRTYPIKIQDSANVPRN
jgi:hypothetical protein